jgi:hypothetical protein
LWQAEKLMLYYKGTTMYKLYKLLIWVQGLYTLITAIWGLLDIDSFMAVTGPKYDIWLVKTVSALLVAISASLLSFLAVRAHPLPAIVLGSLAALGLAAIDIYYTAIDRIKWVYFLDAVPEFIFFIAWMVLFIKRASLTKKIMAS